MPSSTPPDRIQQEIDDVIRLAEKRLERQSLPNRVRRQVRRTGTTFPTPRWSLPPAETLAGWGLALLLVSWLFSLVGRAVPLLGLVILPLQALGILLLVVALVLSLSRGRSGGGPKTWRGERLSYGNPYGNSDFVRRLRRMFSGRR